MVWDIEYNIFKIFPLYPIDSSSVGYSQCLLKIISSKPRQNNIVMSMLKQRCCMIGEISLPNLSIKEGV